LLNLKKPLTDISQLSQLRGGELNFLGHIFWWPAIIYLSLMQQSQNAQVDGFQLPIKPPHHNFYSSESQYRGLDSSSSSLQMRARKDRNDYSRKYDNPSQIIFGFWMIDIDYK